MADHSPDATKKVDPAELEELAKLRISQDFVAMQKETAMANNVVDPADVVRLLNVVGDVGTCKGCGETIWWVKTKAGKSAPYTEKALNHFADCPKADRFRKPETKTE